MVRNVSYRVELPGDLNDFVRDEVAAGRCRDVESAVRAALERLREDAAQHAVWRDAIELGAAQAEQGHLAEGEAAFERVRERLRAKHGNVL